MDGWTYLMGTSSTSGSVREGGTMASGHATEAPFLHDTLEALSNSDNSVSLSVLFARKPDLRVRYDVDILAWYEMYCRESCPFVKSVDDIESRRMT